MTSHSTSHSNMGHSTQRQAPKKRSAAVKHQTSHNSPDDVFPLDEEDLKEF